MTDVFSKAKRSEVMSQIRSENTKPELALRKALFKLGYRYRCNVKQLPGKPDIVLPKYRTAIQVRGCFWHGHTCNDGHIPKSRRAYWEEKLARNKRRDRRTDRQLRALGWSVLTVWECRIRTAAGLEREVRRIVRHLRGRV